MRLRGLLSVIAMSLGAGLWIVGPASGQTGPTVTINPTSGPIGTTITATVTNCVAANGDGTARLDFVIEGFTPANSEFFTPDADGNATVTIQALDKEGQTENVTAARVAVSQCVGGSASAPFTIIRQQATTTTSTAPGATTTTSTAPGATTTTVARQSGTTTTTVRTTTAIPTTPTAAPVAGRPAFTG